MALASVSLWTGCSRHDGDAAQPRPAPAAEAPSTPSPAGTASVPAQAAPGASQWKPVEVELAADQVAQARRDAAAALDKGDLYGDAKSAIPLYRALVKLAPDDAEARRGLERSLRALLEQGDAALAEVDADPAALPRAREIGMVANSIAAEDQGVVAFAQRLSRAEKVHGHDLAGERALHEGKLGEGGGGALAEFRAALELEPAQPRALQGLADVERGLIERAEAAAGDGDFDAAAHWLDAAASVRADQSAVDEARQHVAAARAARIASLRDKGLAALDRPGGIDAARANLAEILRIAPPGEDAAAELRQRIDLASHYGLFRPGQGFTDALDNGARGPEMVVVPHGGYRMGAGAGDPAGEASERPQHYVRFDRGFALSVTEVTVGDFGRFIAATGYRTRAERRGYSIAYDERSGNLVRRSGVDWHSDYAGRPASDDLPVVHVSARDAEAYAAWLSKQTGARYRLPSEAEWEYAVRAGGSGKYPWGDGAPPRGAGNFTGGRDQSPSGRGWRNAFEGYGDGYWGPAPAGSFPANAYGLHEIAGNVSEWVEDCWHDGYRRAPSDGRAWFNPGCRTRVVRGGSWASSPAQTRSAWRTPADADTTNARIGFRVARGI